VLRQIGRTGARNGLQHLPSILFGSGVELIALVINRVADPGDSGNVCIPRGTEGEQRGCLHLDSQHSF
jgi:hypothetical protein